MAKKEKDKKEEAEESLDESEESSEKKKGGLGLIPIALAAIVAAGGGGAGAYFFAPGQTDEVANEDTAGDGHHSDGGDTEEEKSEKSKHAKKEKKKKKKKKKEGDYGGGDEAGSQKVTGGAFETHEDIAYYLLDPFIISIQPIGRARHLKMSIVLETSPEHEEALIAHSYRIRDVINIYLRSVDSAELENPAAMIRLKTQIKRRVRLIMADDAVENVLITEFILT